MFKFFLKNQSNKTILFGLPLLISLFVLFICPHKPTINLDAVIASFSIILMLNVTALFQISKNVLSKLFRTTNKNGDSYYKILKNKYEVTIYSSFIYIAFLLILNFIDIKNTYLAILLSGVVLYILILLIYLNITLVKYYFETLQAELKTTKPE